MKLLFLIGDAAVGKMTTGQELMKITDLRLFHNHMTIEPVLEIFGRWDDKTRRELRDVIFKNFAASDLYGMIFTYMMDFDSKHDLDYLEYVMDIFRPYGTQFYFVELIAPQSVRLERNASENRLKNKPSKRDVDASNRRLIDDDAHHRCVSRPGEIKYENYFRLENENLSAAEAAKLIKERFNL